MDYNIHISDSGKYGILRVTTAVTTSLAESFTKDVLQFSHENDIKLFLYDLTEAPSSLSVFEQYDLIYNRFAKLELYKIHKIAFLVDEKDHSHDFIVTLSINRGSFNRKAFINRDEAIQWLTTKDEN